MKTLPFFILTLSLFLVGCEDPAANKTKAEVSEPTTATNTVTEIPKAKDAKGTELKLNSENSKVEFTGSKVTGKHDGGFKNIDGTIDLVNEKPEESMVSVDIDMKSVYTDADGLTEHLQKEDFFMIEKYPKSTFVSTKIVPDTAKGESNYTITGDLEMRGQKKSISFPATIKVTDEKVDVNAEFAINRKDFGIVYAGKADDLIRDDVVLRLDLNSERNK